MEAFASYLAGRERSDLEAERRNLYANLVISFVIHQVLRSAPYGVRQSILMDAATRLLIPSMQGPLTLHQVVLESLNLQGVLAKIASLRVSVVSFNSDFQGNFIARIKAQYFNSARLFIAIFS
jgi:hypothetical protein